MSSRLTLTLAAVLWSISVPAWGQSDLRLDKFDSFSDRKPTGVRHSLIADVTALAPGQPFRVGISFEVEKGFHFYYKTPGSTGLPTQVNFKLPPGFKVSAIQYPLPDVKHEKLIEPAILYVYKKPTILFAEVTPPENLEVGSTVEIGAEVKYQFCDSETCRVVSDNKLKLSVPVEASAAPTDQKKLFDRAARSAAPQVDKSAVVTVEPYLNAGGLRLNGNAKLALDLTIAEGSHIQMNQPDTPDLISTEVILDLPSGVELKSPIYPEPIEPLHPLEGFENVREYRGVVTVIVPLHARLFVEGNETTIRGYVRYQACNDEGVCQPEAYAPFELIVPVMPETADANEDHTGVFAVGEAPAPPTKPPVEPAPVAPLPAVEPTVSAAALPDTFEVVRQEQLGDNLLLYLAYAFLGGLFLNVMPCVLPVIAIKVLGFVNQAGESRAKIFSLNLAYSAGVIGVFLVLAALAAFAKVGWGQLFQSAEFNLAMASIVFVMGLSLLGMFEIPVPGFAGTIDTSKKEGPLGAFLTGMLATLLATPCSGPFMGVALSWSVQQSVPVIFGVWGMLGVGMAFPYMLAGVFPQVIKLLPRPGMWMVRFKEMAGFVLMATVVYICWYLDETYIVPLLLILLGCTLAMWMISNLYHFGSPSGKKLVVRTLSLGLIVGSWFVALNVIMPWAEQREEERFQRRLAEMGSQPSMPITPIETEPDAVQDAIAWIPFTEANLDRYRKEKKTVFIDFTADWCLICKANERTAIDTPKVRELIKSLGVVTLKADFTDGSKEIKEWLTKFGKPDGGLPYYVILPASDPAKAIVFDGALTQSTMLAKLKEGGPSVAVATNHASRDTVTALARRASPNR